MPPIAERGTGFRRRLVSLFLESESETGADFVHRASVLNRVAKRSVETEILVNLPDGANEHRAALTLRPDLVVKSLEHGADFPCPRSSSLRRVRPHWEETRQAPPDRLPLS
jgi:hypothetical protein